MRTLNLFKKNDFRIIKLKDSDSKCDSKYFQDFKELILTNDNMYPGIDIWLNKQVIKGLKTKERSAFVGYQGETPIISAVVKNGDKSKFCHLRIKDNFQNLNLGEIFFARMALEVRDIAKEIHFTLPESLWESKNDFFKSFGFIKPVKCKNQYRSFDPELKCSADFKTVWENVINKLPKLMIHFNSGGYSLENDILLSVKSEFADKILSGDKKIEVRRKFNKKWVGHTAAIYSSGLDRSLVGEAYIDRVISGAPSDIWSHYGDKIAVSKENYDNYTKSSKEVYAIFLTDVHPYREKIPINQISHLLDNDLKPPQSYYTLKNNMEWLNAVSLAGLLHGDLRFNSKEIKQV